jgi:hypothetical protein
VDNIIIYYIFYYYFLPKKSNRPLHLSFFHSFLFIAIFERKADSWIARIELPLVVASQAQLALASLATRSLPPIRAAIIGFPGFPGFLPALLLSGYFWTYPVIFFVENRKSQNHKKIAR